jgi:predicted Zn-ribbon and HTH transcriptional regulator
MNDVYVIRQHQYDACITRIAELLDQGDQETVKQAMEVWNKDRGETAIGDLDHVSAFLDKDAKGK